MIRNFVLTFTNSQRTAVFTKLLIPGSLFSTSLSFVFETVAVTKPLVSGIFLSTSPIFSFLFSFKFC